MSVHRVTGVIVILAAVLVGGLPSLTFAQGAPPVSGVSGTVVASGLTNPRGMTWGDDGTLFVALAGSGGTRSATEDAPTTQAIGPFAGGPTGAHARIGGDGCPTAVATGLPSTADGIGGVLGAEDVAILGDQLYVSVDGGGPVHGNPGQPSGVYRVLADGSTVFIADLSAWIRANPSIEVSGDHDPDAAGYSMVADAAAGVLWVSDPNNGQILSVTPDGTVTLIADVSAGHPVPTRMVLEPNGGVYVGTLTAAPFPDGAANVMHVAADGAVTDVWTGLTTVTDVAIGPDGTLYAIEMSTNNLAEPPFLQPGTGRIVRQTGPDQLEVTADGLMLPVALDVGPDGAFHVSAPSIGANGGEGVILRFDLTGQAVAAGSAGTCSPIPETLAPAAGASTPAAETQAAPAAVDIEGFAFTPDTLEVPAGTTVTWTNNDSTAHTATANDGSWDTGSIEAGASASVTFDTPGTYTYVCSFHPNMTATIVVT